MTPTAWDVRNKLLAILNVVRHSGKPYLDLESGSLYAETGGDANSKRRMSICHDVMTRMMRPGDVVLNESRNGEGATILIRYSLQNPTRQRERSHFAKSNLADVLNLITALFV